RVGFVMRGLVVSRLAVLQYRDQQEGDDRGRRVDLELVLGIEKRPEIAVGDDLGEPLNEPERHEQHAAGKERRPTGEVRCPAGKPVEEPDPARHIRGHPDSALLTHWSLYTRTRDFFILFRMLGSALPFGGPHVEGGVMTTVA